MDAKKNGKEERNQRALNGFDSSLSSSFSSSLSFFLSFFPFWLDFNQSGSIESDLLNLSQSAETV